MMQSKENLHCPVCQLPLKIIKISSSAHISQCISSWTASGLEECPDGIKCLSENVFHYRDYSHLELAIYRSLPNNLESNAELIISSNKQRTRKNSNVNSPLKSHSFIDPHEKSYKNKYSSGYNSDSDNDLIMPSKRLRVIENTASDSSCRVKMAKRGRSMNLLKHKKPSSNVSDKNISLEKQNLKKTLNEEVSINTDEDMFEDDLFCSLVSKTVSDPSLNISGTIQNMLSAEKTDLDVLKLKTSTTDGKSQIKPIAVKNIPICKDISKSNDKEQWKTLLKRMRDKKVPEDLKINTYYTFNVSGYSDLGVKKCPFYKLVSGTPFAVDAFQYGSIPGVNIYFLTHFHSDHYIGLRKNFSHPIYCSKITANLVRQKIRVDSKWLNVLTLNQPEVIFGIEVTALDANHCPGSLMFLFRLKNGCNYLHVGDFRASPKMCSYPELKHLPITKLYLDTTYCDKQYVFPSQEEIINKLVSIVQEQYQKYPKLLVVCGSYLIGKEKVFLGLAETLNWKIWARTDKRKIFECLDDRRINSRLTLNGNEAKVHVMPMNHINHQNLVEHMIKFPEFNYVIGLKPTGWELNSKSDQFKVYKYNNCSIYGVPYSEHSSYNELEDFVKFIQPNEIVPTVNVGNPASRKKMKSYFQEWMECKSTETKIGLKQPTVSKYFS